MFDKLFDKSKRIYVNDPEFAKLPNQYAEFIDFFDTSRLSGNANKSASSGAKIIVNISANERYALYINGKAVFFSQFPSVPDKAYFDSVDITEHVSFEKENKLAVLTYYSGLSQKNNSCHTPGLIFEVKHYAPSEKVGLLLLASSSETISRISPEYSSGQIPFASENSEYTFEYDSVVNDGWYENAYKIIKGNRSRISWLGSASLDSINNYCQYQTINATVSEAVPSKIIAQGLFDCGNEYRNTHTKSQAYYMQNAALKSKSFPALSQNCITSELPSNISLEYTFSASDNSEAPLCGKGIYAVIDLMRDECGYLQLDVEAPAGTVITITYGNHLSDLRVRSLENNNNYSCSYICNGKRTVFNHYIHSISGRYLQIFAECNKFTLYSCSLIPVSRPKKRSNNTFFYSDALHRKIYDTAIHTLKISAKNSPLRSFSELRNSLLCEYYAFGDYSSAKQVLEQLAAVSKKDGLLSLPDKEKTIPVFSLYWVQALTDYALYSGDLAFVFELLPAAEKIMKLFSLHSHPGKALFLLDGNEYLNFHENTQGLDGTLAEKLSAASNSCYDANLTALFIISLEKMAQTFAFMAMTEGFMNELNSEHLKKANSYMDLCEKMRSQFNNTFLDKEKKLYASYATGDGLHDYSELTNALAIYCGACQGSLQKDVTGVLIDNKSRALNRISMSYILCKYEAVMLENSKNIDFVMTDIENRWGTVLFSGATSFTATQCDVSAFAPIIIYYKYILGLRPIRPGFSEYSCIPRQYSCHTASGTVKTPAGTFTIGAGKENYNYKLI